MFRSHAPSNGYLRILKHVRSFTPDGPLTLGVTATPHRSDGVGLDQVFQKIVYQKGLLESIVAGYLADIRAMEVKLDMDLSKVTVEGGDFEESDLGRVLEAVGITDVIVKTYTQCVAPKKTIVFVPTVHLAHQTAESLVRAGFTAEALDGKTKPQERQEILARFKSGETSIVVNMGCLTEGFDEPSIECVLLARPTKSWSLFLQLIGRGLRLWPEKKFCLLVDIGGYASSEHNLISVSDITGFSIQQLQRNGLIRSAIQRHAKKKGIELPPEFTGEILTEEVSLFRSEMEWLRVDPDTYTIGIPNGTILAQRGNDRFWNVAVQRREMYELLGSKLSLPYAQGIAEDFIRTRKGTHIVLKSATWKDEQATDKQLEAMIKWGLDTWPGITKGQASNALTVRIAQKAIQNLPSSAGRETAVLSI